MTDTVLPEHRRGDKFTYSSSLAKGYVSADFDELRFTIRAKYPDSSVTTDTAANGAIAQAARDDVTIEAAIAGTITFSDTTNFTVEFSSSVTTNWDPKKYYWDFQGTIAGEDSTLDSGTIRITGDVTRQTA